MILLCRRYPFIFRVDETRNTMEEILQNITEITEILRLEYRKKKQ